jgi:hypothetical protein
VTVVKKGTAERNTQNETFILPRPQDVDDEKWMAAPSDEEMGQASVPLSLFPA